MQRHVITKCSALLLVSSLGWARADEPVALPHLDEVASSGSVFVDDPKFGKDPFFPKSTRHIPKIVPQIGLLPDVSPFSQVVGNVVLKGVSGLPGRRLALLNNRTVQAGETVELKVNNQTYKLRCVEVREKSVLVGMDGTTETKEIHLRGGM